MPQSESRILVRILIDARKLGDGGIGTYIETLIDGLIERRDVSGADITITLLIAPTKSLKSEFPSRWTGQVRTILEPAGKYSITEYLLMYFRHRATFKSHDLYHSPHYTLPYFVPTPSVVTIHDAIHVSHPETVMHRLIGKWLIRSAMRRATKVITVSKVSADEIAHIAADSHTSEKINVIPNAVRTGLVADLDEAFEHHYLSKSSVRLPYCLFVGNPKPHKGWSKLLEAWKIVREALGPDAPQLVVVGYGFHTKHFLEALEVCGNEGVMFLRGVSVSQQGILFRNASLLLFPSEAEGFGLPVLEAMASGTRVIASPLQVVREVAGETVTYTKGDDAAAFAEAVLRSLASQENLVQVKSAKVRSQLFTSMRLAEETYRVYESCLRT